MDRRRFLICSCSLLACSSRARDLDANSVVTPGCRRGASAGLSEGDLRPTSGQPSYDMFCRQWHAIFAADFKVQPGFSFFDDADAPNAYAQLTALFPEAPDGTVLVGVKLLKEE